MTISRLPSVDAFPTFSVPVDEDTISKPAHCKERAPRPDELPPGDARDSLAHVHDVLKRELPRSGLSIYEAGGGSSSYLPTSLFDGAKVTVVDIDAVQLANNAYADEKILGDIQSQRFPPERFDLIVCYNVIEHLPDVPAAFQRFFEALKPGGLILIGAPNPHSASGMVTKYSPHWFHVWFYRVIRGNKRAGQPGEPPFPTYYHPLVTPRTLKRYVEGHGCEVVYERLYESPRYAEMRIRRPALAKIADGITSLMNAVLLRQTNVRHGDYHLVIRKR